MISKMFYKNQHVLSYSDHGPKTGFPILVQHGLIASIRDSYLFQPLVDFGMRVISIARPGYGNSSPYLLGLYADWGDIVSELIDELNLVQFDVFGISSGAPYCYSLGAKFPDRARNLFILSGMPALYDEEIRSFWPYPVNKSSNIAEMEKLASRLFFSDLSKIELEREDIKDSMRNHCFGVAQDLLLRGRDWGFTLSDVHQQVWMRHSRSDQSVPLITAEMTSRLLPACRLDIHEDDDHFSEEVLADFMRMVITNFYS